MQNNKFKSAVLGSISSLLFVAANTASAVDLEVKDTAVSLYGFAKLDLIYDVDSDLGDLVTHSNIRLDDQDGSDGHTRLHALQSRVGIITLTPTDYGPLKTRIEGDFFGGSGGFRLRHAYGVWNGILAGQTWSNFGNFLGFTPTIDFRSQVGQTFIARQGQLRYTTGGLSVALEAPGTAGGPTAIYSILEPEPITPDASSKDGIPDLTFQYQSSVGPIAYATSAVLRQLSIYDADTDSDESAFGYGVSLSAKFTVSSAMSIQGSVVYGDGIGGYMYSGPAASGFYDPNTFDVETIEAIGGTLGTSIEAGPGAVNLAYGIGTADWDDAEAARLSVGGQNEMFQSIYLNYIWSPIDNVSYGVEAGHHSREVVNGDDGSAVRLQAMAMYSF